MATLNTQLLTLADHAKLYGPDGKPAMIAEMLSETNEILDDMLWREGNLATGTRTTVRTGLPQGTWRALNQGVLPTKSTVATVDESAGMLDALGIVDKALADLNGNTNAFRLQENRAFVEGLNQQMASALFYANDGFNPGQFLGLAPRYSDKSAVNAQNIIDMGGSNNANASIWLINWGEDVHGIYPKGTQAGLEHQDMGVELVDDNTNRSAKFRAYRDYYSWKSGIAVRDWRNVVRIANIDSEQLMEEGEDGTTKIYNAMIRALHRIPARSRNSKLAFYMNRTAAENIDVAALNLKNIRLAVGEEAGRLVTTIRGVPIRTVDALLDTEANVV